MNDWSAYKTLPTNTLFAASNVVKAFFKAEATAEAVKAGNEAR